MTDIICLEHRVVNMSEVPIEDVEMVNAALLELQELSDNAFDEEDFEKANEYRSKYWEIRQSLNDKGITIEYLY